MVINIKNFISFGMLAVKDENISYNQLHTQYNVQK